jgi:hypothetical protein
MSLIEELGARLYASSADLPLGELVAALDRLRAGSALLSWVRQESARPLGVPELAGAIEHLEHAARALLVAQDSLSGYLAAVGLTVDAAPPPDTAWRRALDEPQAPRSPQEPGRVAAPPLGRWWAQRVGVLTNGPVDDVPQSRASGVDLLRRVAGLTDRDGLRRELAGAAPPAGLGLAAIAPPVLHKLAGELLGHRPRAEDLAELTRTAREPVRELLPGLPPEVVDTLLARVCRVPPPPPRTGEPRAGEPPATGHPADSAVAAGVLVGVLLRRLGRAPGELDPAAPEPLPVPDGAGAGR